MMPGQVGLELVMITDLFRGPGIIELALDPNDENTLYVLSASTYKSIDGGKTWEEVDSAYGDYHDLWINPEDSKNMILTSDGGCEITFDSEINGHE